MPIYKTGTIVGNARSPKAEVYALIEEDLVFATQNLLPKGSESAGRANKEAAYAQLGKVLLYQKKYDEALAALNNVTGYSLEDKGNFYNNFMQETEHGKESIFEIEFDEKMELVISGELLEIVEELVLMSQHLEVRNTEILAGTMFTHQMIF